MRYVTAEMFEVTVYIKYEKIDIMVIEYFCHTIPNLALAERSLA